MKKVFFVTFEIYLKNSTTCACTAGGKTDLSPTVNFKVIHKMQESLQSTILLTLYVSNYELRKIPPF